VKFAPLCRIGTLVVAAVAIGACSNAPNGVTGGGDVFDATPPIAPATHCADGTGVTWTDLYRDCFGPGYADCGGTGGCHRSSQDTGTSFSGFLCGTSKESCYEGMVGIDSLVTPSGTQEPEKTRLYAALRKAPPLTSPERAMPNNTGFAFSAGDLARISAWIKNGAKND
jgi:hypothetical protein